MFEATAVEQDGAEETAVRDRTAPATALATSHRFERPLSLLRITNTQISLFHVRYHGGGTAATTARLQRLFSREAMTESLAENGFLLLFVRRGEDGTALTARVLQALRDAMKAPASNARGRVEITAVHRNSGTVGEVDELMAELAFEVANGSGVVAP